MPVTRYYYRHAFAGFFEFPVENARRIVPGHLEPVEAHHGTAIFSLTVFDFDKSEVGPYREAVMDVIVAPLIDGKGPMPKSALYPFMIGTTTRASREHAIERWHLPHWGEDVEVDIDEEGHSVTARVRAGGDPVADLIVTDHSWSRVVHTYQSFMQDDSGAYVATMTMECEQSEHQEESGHLKLYEHPFNRALAISEIYEHPSLEVWMRDGVQTIHPLVQLPTR